MAGAEGAKSDLGTRAVSAVVMIAVAGSALWLGGWVWPSFAVLVGLGVLYEWWGLVRAITQGVVARLIWLIAGVGYVGVALTALITLRETSALPALIVIATVIAVDVGAYFTGRTFGGPKIAPRISPSKTWSGLAGGTLGAALAIGVAAISSNVGQPMSRVVLLALGLGLVVAITAQTGDFFESWMKRRAGVKDSGKLIPGHGGLFDRVDGLLAVLCLVALFDRVVT